MQPCMVRAILAAHLSGSAYDNPANRLEILMCSRGSGADRVPIHCQRLFELAGHKVDASGTLAVTKGLPLMHASRLLIDASCQRT